MKILIQFVLLFLLCNCSETPLETPGGKTEPINPVSSNNIIPFSMGNQWTYVDSLFTTDSTFVDTLTIKIVSSRHIEDEERVNKHLIWWSFNQRLNPSVTSLEFAAQGDSVFSLQEALGGTAENPQLVPVVSVEYLIPESSSMEYDATTSGDGVYIKTVSFIEDSLSMNIFSTDKFLLFSYSINWIDHEEFIIPELGIVDLILENNSPLEPKAWLKRRKSLINYNFN
ncbi:MAG: hypothetical protein ACMZ7B_06295 [Balneola sp.]